MAAAGFLGMGMDVDGDDVVEIGELPLGHDDIRLGDRDPN
jgi:hypothetical protein